MYCINTPSSTLIAEFGNAGDALYLQKSGGILSNLIIVSYNLLGGYLWMS